MEAAEIPQDAQDAAGAVCEPVADESDRLSPEQRRWAHLLITQQYETQRRALPAGDAGQDESPFTEIDILFSGSVVED